MAKINIGPSSSYIHAQERINVSLRVYIYFMPSLILPLQSSIEARQSELIETAIAESQLNIIAELMTARRIARYC